MPCGLECDVRWRKPEADGCGAMGDITDGGGFFGEIPPEGEHSKGRFRGQQELEEENARLRAELELWREENTLLADMLARRFEDENGEIDGEEPKGEGRGATGGRVEFTSNFVIPDAAIDLFEALPESFTLDEVLDVAERLSQLSEEAAVHLRLYLDEKMVRQEIDESGNFTGQFAKTGRKPYF